MIKKKDFFIQGLASFLIAHISYILAISYDLGIQFRFLSFLISSIFLILLFMRIVPFTGNKKIPVILYGIVINFLIWQSLNRFQILGDSSSLILLAGVFLFLISDFTLAYNKFVKKIRIGQIIILSTYYTAQVLIAYSV
jgi:uncharacterized membrane protein YhhN